MRAKILQYYSFLKDKVRNAVVSDTLRRRLLVYCANLVLALTSFVMTVVNIFTGEYLLMHATFRYSLFCLLSIILLHFSKIPERIIHCAFCLESLALIVFFYISGIPDGFSALWICLIPSFSLLIFGVRDGSIFSFAALALLIFLFWTPFGRSLLRYSYGEAFMLRLPFLYCSVYLLSLVIEYVRRETQRQLENVKQEYRFLYRHDALTGLYNRYGIQELIEKSYDSEKRGSVSVIMLDIDDFKDVNDAFGHECGDEVLKMVSSAVSAAVCGHGRCCRWGGEEFLVIMPCGHDPAETAEKIRRSVAAAAVEYGGHSINVTVSVGVCAGELASMPLHQLIDRADKAMYLSKRSGKGRVTEYTPEAG